MTVKVVFGFLAFLVAGMLTEVSYASDRVAFVVGNSSYEFATALPNPKNDASDISALLKQLDFEVIQGIDLDRAQMEISIRKFAEASANAKVVLFFYAGHGMQVSGRNYLIPVDAQLEDRTALDFEAIDVDKVFQYMSGDGKIALAFLDACRNNPLARSFAQKLGAVRSAAVGNGLAPTATSGSGLFIAYATAPNDVALDGDGRNSPFTTALLRNLPTPSLEIQQVMTRVKADVQQHTGGRQRPWHNSDLSKEVYLASVSPQPDNQDQQSADVVFWNAVKETNNLDLLRVFIERFPASLYAREAKQKIAALDEGNKPVFWQDAIASSNVRRCELLTEVFFEKIVDVGNRRIRPPEIVEVCEKAVAEHPTNAELVFRLALAYYNVGSVRAYERGLAKASELGNLEAKLRLGGGLSIPHSVTSYDPDRALKLLLEVAEQASQPQAYHAAYMLSNLYKYGPDRIKNEERGRYWGDRYVSELEQNAKLGKPDALRQLGSSLMWGLGDFLLPDPVRARELLEAAHQMGEDYALDILATWYNRDEPGFQKDRAKALELTELYEKILREEVERGNLMALTSLATRYMDYGLTPDIKKAIELSRVGAAEGAIYAYSSLSSLLGREILDWNSKKKNPFYNPKEAKRWHVKHQAAVGNCGAYPHDTIEDIYPDIEMLSTPEKSARCYLDAVRRHNTRISDWRFRNSGPTDFETDHKSTPVSTRMAIQRILRDEGFYSGSIDGAFGPGTLKAVISYRDHR